MIFSVSQSPKFMVFFLTYRCNSRCVMCSAWQKQNKDNEFTLEDIERIFDDKALTRSLERINLTGGEPTLFPPLSEVVRVIVKNCPHLNSIDMPTNGLDTERCIDEIEKVLTTLFPTDTKLCVTVSLDGVGSIHDRVRNIPGAFDAVTNTITGLKELERLYRPKLSVGLNMTINSLNYDDIQNVYDYARKKDIGINFTLAALSEIGVESMAQKVNFRLNEDQKELVINFFEALSKENGNSKYARFIINLLQSGQRGDGCVFRKREAFLLEPTGDIFLCGNYNSFKLGNLKEQKFAQIWRKGSSIYREKWFKCRTCESNCYLE